MQPDADNFPAKRVETLQHPSGQTLAEVLTDCGFNCARWAVQCQGQRYELLWPGGPSANRLASSSTSQGRGLSPFRFGFPILFPFPNRIRGGVFYWAGREYRLPINDPQQRNAIHGLVGDLPWSIRDSRREGYTTSLTGHFHLAEHAPQRLAYWPGDFALTLTWHLAAETRDHELVWAELSAQVHVHNCGEVVLPFGLGFHPYFAVAADQAGIVIESARQKGADLRRWELQDLLPTGRLLPLDESYRQLLESSPTRPLPQWDDAFRYFPASDNDPLIVDLHDKQRGFTLRLEACPAFRELVLFIPPHRQAICIEPYTCVTDAINLYAQGIASGLRVLPPGQTWQAQIRVRFLPSTLTARPACGPSSHLPTNARCTLASRLVSRDNG